MSVFILNLYISVLLQVKLWTLKKEIPIIKKTFFRAIKTFRAHPNLICETHKLLKYKDFVTLHNCVFINKRFINNVVSNFYKYFFS